MASTARIPSVPAPGDAPGLRERARGALLGLAVGDALGAPAENMKPSEIRAKWGRVTGYVTDPRRARTTPSTPSSPDCWWPGTAPRSPPRMSRRPGTSGSPTAPRVPSGAPASASAAPWRTCAGARRAHLRPAPARLERRAGDAGGAVRRVRGRTPGRGGPARGDRRFGQPRRRGHLRRAGGRGGRRGGHGRGTGGHRRGLGTGGGAGRLLDRPLAAPRGDRRPPRRTRRPRRGGDRRLPLDRPGARGGGPGLRRVRDGRRRLRTGGADRREHGPRRRHDGGGRGRAGGGDPGCRRRPGALGRGHHPGPRQLPARHGRPPRPRHRGPPDPGDPT